MNPNRHTDRYAADLHRAHPSLSPDARAARVETLRQTMEAGTYTPPTGAEIVEAVCLHGLYQPQTEGAEAFAYETAEEEYWRCPAHPLELLPGFLADCPHCREKRERKSLAATQAAIAREKRGPGVRLQRYPELVEETLKRSQTRRTEKAAREQAFRRGVVIRKALTVGAWVLSGVVSVLAVWGFLTLCVWLWEGRP